MQRPPEGRQVGRRRADLVAVDDSSGPAGDRAQGPPHERRRERREADVPPQKVRHVTTVHSISDPRIFHKECRGLAALGYDVGLIACHDRSRGRRREPHRGDRPPAGPARSHGEGRAGRPTAPRCPSAPTSTTSTIPSCLGRGAAKLRGRRVVYDVHEDVPKQIMSKHWIPARARPLVSRTSPSIEGRPPGSWTGSSRRPRRSPEVPRAETVVVQNFPETSFTAATAAPP